MIIYYRLSGALPLRHWRDSPWFPMSQFCLRRETFSQLEKKSIQTIKKERAANNNKQTNKQTNSTCFLMETSRYGSENARKLQSRSCIIIFPIIFVVFTKVVY